MKRAKINGLSLGFIQKGKGEALILLHGGVSDSRYWRTQVDSFSRGFNVIAWDAPGCGISDDPPKNFSLADYADSLAGLIDYLEIKHPHILGLSFGGGLAISFYERYPEIPQTLILVSAYAGWAGSLPKDEVRRRVQHARAQAKMDRDSVSEAWLPSLFSPSATQEMKHSVKSIIKDFHPEGMLVMLDAFADADLRGVLPNITVPTLLLYGEEDARSPIHVAKNLHDLIPTSELIIIPGIGHLVNVEAPIRFESYVTDFIVKHSQIPGS
jgi:pimeloyl-ACP methyl ester carboxylesterase